MTYDNIQNCCLSGAVMISASCDMYSFPLPAIIVGLVAGTVSIITYHFLPKLLEKAKYFDTRGILYFHGIPAFLGGLWSWITWGTLQSGLFGIASN